MEDENLKEWVEKKIDAGVSPEAIKESLENTGNDPSLVDEVISPFDSEPDIEKNAFESERKSQESNERDKEQKDTREEKVEFTDLKDKIVQRFDFSLPKVSYSFEVSSLKTSRRFKLVLAAFLTVLIGLSAIFYVSDSVLRELKYISGDVDCSENGLRINSVRVEDERTISDVLLTGPESDIVLKVYTDGKVVGQKYDRFTGIKTIEVEAVGEKVFMHLRGCENRNSTYNY